MWTTVHQIEMLKMIPKMKNLNLMMKVVMVDLIKLVTQTYRTNLPSNRSAINNHPNSRKEQKITGKQKLTTKKKQPQGSKKPVPKKNKTDGYPNWKKLQTEFVNPNQSIPFPENPGIKKRNTDTANTPLDNFFPFLTNDIIDQIVTQTSLYYDQVKASKPSTKCFTPT